MRATTPVEHLGEAIAELASRLHAATYELLLMIRQFDAEAGWNNGFASCAHWLNWRTGIDLGAAREKVRVAKALADLPLLSESLRRGEVSYAKVRARPAWPHRRTKRNSSTSRGPVPPTMWSALCAVGGDATAWRLRGRPTNAISAER
jgi:hypothetical protein